MSKQLMTVYNFALISRMNRDKINMNVVYIDGVGEYGGVTHYFDTPQDADKFMHEFRGWCDRYHTGGYDIYEEEEK